jgi:phage/plasmid primase-like uncharacterized protein
VTDRIKTSELVKGRWPQILRALGVPAKALNGRNGPCLFCGGRDRARFTNFKDSGSYLCNQCGTHGGWKFIQRFKGWSFKQAAAEIDRVLSSSSYLSASRGTRAEYFPTDEINVPRSTQQCALWLRKYHPQKLEPWLESRSPEVRWWLETQT